MFVCSKTQQNICGVDEGRCDENADFKVCSSPGLRLASQTNLMLFNQLKRHTPIFSLSRNDSYLQHII